MREPPKKFGFPVRTPSKVEVIFLYSPKRYPISLPPTPMSPAGTSIRGPIYLCSSRMNEEQNFITSKSLLPLGSKSDPPLPPPIGRPVNAFLKICSKPRNFKIPSLTVGWKRSPPLYGPSVLLNCTRYPVLTWICWLSSIHSTLNLMILSGTTRRLTMACRLYFSSEMSSGAMERSTSSTA